MQMSWQVYNIHFPPLRSFKWAGFSFKMRLKMLQKMLNMERKNGEDFKLPYSHLFMQKKSYSS